MNIKYEYLDYVFGTGAWWIYEDLGEHTTPRTIGYADTEEEAKEIVKEFKED